MNNNIYSQNMPNQGFNPLKMENGINEGIKKKQENKNKKIVKKNAGKKFKEKKKKEKTDGNINENDSSKRNAIPFKNKKNKK